jgi:hypothetical protein
MRYFRKADGRFELLCIDVPFSGRTYTLDDELGFNWKWHFINGDMTQPPIGTDLVGIQGMYYYEITREECVLAATLMGKPAPEERWADLTFSKAKGNHIYEIF